ncbi:unnamed protein product [Onchocerca flexuosa]|uniref:Secreted protein n=1 Tax=Onchocerca flexuosa TaxID=387005 RepID=A0A183H4C7_9BILA|nr:unnamed protein product [Onchocerca flexuosa]
MIARTTHDVLRLTNAIGATIVGTTHDTFLKFRWLFGPPMMLFKFYIFSDHQRYFSSDTVVARTTHNASCQTMAV